MMEESTRYSAIDSNFRKMADCSPVLLWMAEPDARCTFFNQSWLSFRGRTVAQEFGYGWAEGIHPEDFESCMNRYMSAFVSRCPFEMEYRLQRADGVFRWLLDRGAPRYEVDGTFAGYIGSCVDITEIKEARQAVERNAESVARANQQIERFLFAASHDLQEPVRMVRNYAELLSAEHAADLPQQGRDFLGFMQDGAQRLSQMVEGLSAFLSVRHSELGLRPVRLDELVQMAQTDLRLLLNEQQATIEVEAGELLLLADPALLVRVFSNLLANALKFRSALPLVIRVRGELQSDGALVSVSDNGIGFDPAHGARIFEMFQRLVPRSYPGSGIGLAICREIVELHGGRIWANGEPGRGAVFSFKVATAAAPTSA
jgi:PAS domain S-box-containing protein